MQVNHISNTYLRKKSWCVTTKKTAKELTSSLNGERIMKTPNLTSILRKRFLIHCFSRFKYTDLLN